MKEEIIAFGRRNNNEVLGDRSSEQTFANKGAFWGIFSRYLQYYRQHKKSTNSQLFLILTKQRRLLLLLSLLLLLILFGLYFLSNRSAETAGFIFPPNVVTIQGQELYKHIGYVANLSPKSDNYDYELLRLLDQAERYFQQILLQPADANSATLDWQNHILNYLDGLLLTLPDIEPLHMRLLLEKVINQYKYKSTVIPQPLQRYTTNRLVEIADGRYIFAPTDMPVVNIDEDHLQIDMPLLQVKKDVNQMQRYDLLMQILSIKQNFEDPLQQWHTADNYTLLHAISQYLVAMEQDPAWDKDFPVHSEEFLKRWRTDTDKKVITWIDTLVKEGQLQLYPEYRTLPLTVIY